MHRLWENSSSTTIAGSLTSGEENSRSEKAILELLLIYAIPRKDVSRFY